MSTNYILQLKHILDSQSLAQQQLAEKLEVYFATLNRWLNKHAVPHKERLGQICRWNSGKPKNIQSIAEFHSGVELIHPFGDGNGRVGRLIMALQCQAGNYAPVIIENSRKAEYYEVLEYAQRKSEHPFVSFLVDEMKRTFRIIKKYTII